MFDTITLFLEIAPVAQERIRFHFKGWGRRRQILPYIPTKTREYQNSVRAMVREYMSEFGIEPFDKNSPLELDITFYLKPPKTMPKGRTLPTVRPDLDNYLKALLDAIQPAAKGDDEPALLADDSSVCEIRCRKVYCNSENPEPGVLLIATRLT